MNGAEHYREAERLLDLAQRPVTDSELGWMARAQVAAEAQVHATLAHAAATALNLPHPDAGLTTPDWEAWTDAASAYERPRGQA